MIPNQWYPVYESRRLRKRPVALQRMGERLVLWRDGLGIDVDVRADQLLHAHQNLSHLLELWNDTVDSRLHQLAREILPANLVLQALAGLEGPPRYATW